MNNGFIRLGDIQEFTTAGYENLGSLLTDRHFSSSEVGVDKKILSYWKTKGLVDFQERKEWTEVSFIGLLWLRVLDSMRKLGCRVALMKEVYDYFFTRAYNENLAGKRRHDYLTQYRQLQKAGTINSDQRQKLEALEMIEANEFLKLIFRYEINYFYSLVINCLHHGAETGIIIYPDGKDLKFEEYIFHPDIRSEEIALKFNQPHINIPISSFILEFLSEDDKQGFAIKANILDEDELRVIREIRKRNISLITITLNTETGAVEKIESDEKGLIKNDKAREIMKLLGMKNYSGVELKTRDGKTLSFTRRQRKY